MSDEKVEAAPEESAAAAPVAGTTRLVVGLSVASGVVGLIPLPLVGDLAIGALRVFLVQRIAKRRGLSVSTSEAMIISGGSTPSLDRLATTTAAVLGLRFAWRRLSRSLLLLFRFEDMARTFLLGTYFDRYCREYHASGQGDIQLSEADALHRAIDGAISSVHLHLISALFKKVVSDVIQAGTFIPRTLWSMCIAALASDDGDEVEQVVEQDVQGFFSRVASLVEEELSETGEVTRAALHEAFDSAWRASAAAAPKERSALEAHPDPSEQPSKET